MRVDGEASIVALAEHLKGMWTGEIILEGSPAGGSESNDQAERAIRTLVGQTRTLKLAYESKVGCPLPPDSAGMKWLVEYAACTLRRYSVGTDGRTSYERSKGKR